MIFKIRNFLLIVKDRLNELTIFVEHELNVSGGGRCPATSHRVSHSGPGRRRRANSILNLTAVAHFIIYSLPYRLHSYSTNLKLNKNKIIFVIEAERAPIGREVRKTPNTRQSDNTFIFPSFKSTSRDFFKSFINI